MLKLLSQMWTVGSLSSWCVCACDRVPVVSEYFLSAGMRRLAPPRVFLTPDLASAIEPQFLPNGEWQLHGKAWMLAALRVTALPTTSQPVTRSVIGSVCYFCSHFMLQYTLNFFEFRCIFSYMESFRSYFLTSSPNIITLCQNFTCEHHYKQ